MDGKYITFASCILTILLFLFFFGILYANSIENNINEGMKYPKDTKELAKILKNMQISGAVISGVSFGVLLYGCYKMDQKQSSSMREPLL
jgi:hypothetical protein